MLFDSAILRTGIYPKEIMDNMINYLGTMIFIPSGNSRISILEGILSKSNCKRWEMWSSVGTALCYEKKVSLVEKEGLDRD